MAQTAQDTLADRPNKVQVTDVGPSRKKISIEIPAETVSEQLDTSLDTLAGEAVLPGFRRGHAPRRLLEKKFGADVKREARNQLIATAFNRAVEEHGLKVVGDPIAPDAHKAELESGKPLTIEVEVEVRPEFELPPLEGIEIRKPTLSITDDMVARELERACQFEGTLEPREVAEPGDYCTGHAVMKGADGTVHLDLPGAVIQVPPADREGKGMIVGILVEDFAKQLGTPKPGDELAIKTVGPEGHENEALRGKELTISFKVDRVDRILPATEEELAQKLGLPEAGMVRDFFKARMNQRVMIDQQSAMRSQLAKHLLEKTTFDLPERLTAVQSARTLERRRMELMYRGVDPQRIEERLAELRAASHTVAVRELKLFFILDKAAETLDIGVNEGEMNGRIAQMAAQRSTRPEKLRQELMQAGQLGMVYQQIREHKTLDAILSKATLTEMPAEEFNAWAKEEAGR